MDVLFGGSITEVSTCKTGAEVKTGLATYEGLWPRGSLDLFPYGKQCLKEALKGFKILPRVSLGPTMI